MVTPDEIGAVAIFAGLDAAARERLSRVAADISLVPGEWAVPEGGDRALFAVLEGHLEVVKLIDGIERLIGQRNPGEICGEIPITLGTAYPAGFRATVPSRVMRIEPNDYHAVPAAARISASRSGSSRSTGSDGPADPRCRAAEPRAVVVGRRLDPACAELRHFLDRNQITFTWVEPDAPDADEQWGGPLPAEGDWPAIRVIDGKTVVRPQLTTGGRAARPRDRAGGGGVRHGDHRWRARGAGGGRLRRVGGPADDRRSSARRPAARPARRRGSRTTSASRRASRATSWPSRALKQARGSARRSS